MNFMHWNGYVGPDDTIVVSLDHAANVQLMDELNFSSYRQGRAFRYLGGHYRVSPVVLRPPHSGHWHVAIDLGGRSGYLRAGVKVLTNAA